ncbi:MAG TPA: hypothetical protein VK348_11375 [Planctomycetota bacterium]|nr:hypothetical protein [Planctomycetota bacterium]
MQTFTTRRVLLAVLAAAGFSLAACQNDKHTMVEPRPGTTVMCRECYDEVTTVRRNYPATHGNETRTETIRTHHCPACKTDVSIYVENGVLMVKCVGCAPDGVACDKCLPPDGAKR